MIGKRTLTETAKLVGINVKTLRRRIRLKGIELSVDPEDRRCLLLADTLVNQLIQEHNGARLNGNKSIETSLDELSDVPIQNIKKLSKEIAQLRSDIKDLRRDIDIFREEFSNVRDTDKRTLSQLSQKISSLENFLRKI